MVLENVLCARAWSSEQQCELLVELAVRSVDGLLKQPFTLVL
jgi:meiotic recombination protein DMC1